MKCLLWLPLLGAFICVGTNGCFLPESENDVDSEEEDGTTGTTLAVTPEELTVLGKHILLEMEEWKRRGLPENITFPGKDESNPITSSLTAASIDAMGLFIPNYETDVKFHLFNQDNPDGTVVPIDTDEIQKAGWNSSLKTKVLVHGWGSSVSDDMIQNNKKALLKEGDYNVIGVDWSKLCPAGFYILSRSHVQGVAEYVAKLMGTLIDQGMLTCEDLHVIGHSLGAHVAGTIGKEMQNRVSCSPGRITGLDPAMPLFLLINKDRLASTDGEFVDVIHTCSGLLGLSDALGTWDFYPNGGKKPQPGCGIDLVGSCSHGRSHQMFAESIIEKNTFTAGLCADNTQALDSDCPESNVTSHMGFWLRPSEPGSYYLETADSYPFDLLMHEEAEQNRES